MKDELQNPTQFNQQCYDRWADTYDAQPNSTLAADDLFFPSTWEHVENRRVLEIGCGTGRHTVRLVAQRNQVTAIDLSAAMLAKARLRTDLGKVTFIPGDFLAMPALPDNAFDIAVTSLVLEHIQDLSLFFRKVANALRNGGEFFLSEIHPDRIAGGAQANFVDRQSGETVKLASFPHTRSQILNVALSSGLSVVHEKDVVGTNEIARLHPGWEKHLGKPLVKMWCFRKSATCP